MKVRAIEKCYDGLCIREQGDEFDYDGPPHASLEPVKAKEQEREDEPAAQKKRGRPPKVTQEQAEATAE